MNESLAREARTAWETGGEAALETLLADRLAHLDPAARVAEIRRLADSSDVVSSPRISPEASEIGDVDRLLARVFRDRNGIAGPGDASRVDRLADALNLVFDAVNRIAANIDATLYARDPEATIRHHIGAHMGGTGETASLTDRIDRIGQAFLDAHEAYRAAARTQAVGLLDRLDPEAIQAEGNLKFGPFGKADRFRAFEAMYRSCRDWVESPKFMEEFLREFEREIRKKFAEKGGRS